MKIVIATKELSKMRLHAVESYPNECCGFIFGSERENLRKVTEARPAINSKKGNQSRRYEIAPLDYLHAERYAAEEGLTLLGIYHSHPDHPAVPSQHDLKRAVYFFSYLILSVDKDGVQAITSWQLVNDRFKEEKILDENKIEIVN